MRYFPLFLDLLNKPVLVVGGGEVACRKVEALLKAGADITLISPSVAKFLRDLIDAGEIHWVQNFYSSHLMDGRYIQVWATTDNPELNHQVYKDAKEFNILVNVVDDKPYCDFITPSMMNRGRIQIAISSGGASPVLIRNLREKFEAQLPQNLALVTDFCDSKRNHIKEVLPSVDDRRKFWEVYLGMPQVEHAMNKEDLEQAYQKALNHEVDDQGSLTWIEYQDDVELLPMKALRLMQQAELVLYHQDTPEAYLELSRRDAERELFSDAVTLSHQLKEFTEQGLRICVYVPDSAEYELLRAGQPLIRGGSVSE